MAASPGDRCPHCGGEVVRAIPVGQTAEAGRIGLEYHALGPLRGTEPLRADLCRGCGTVVRLHVETPDRRWISGR